MGGKHGKVKNREEREEEGGWKRMESGEKNENEKRWWKREFLIKQR